MLKGTQTEVKFDSLKMVCGPGRNNLKQTEKRRFKRIFKNYPSLSEGS